MNDSASSIPTLYDDREETLESPNSSAAEESARVSSGQDKEEGELHEQETEAAGEEITEGAEVKVEEEEPVEEERASAEKEQAGSDYTPPGSRQVSGRSATPKTVVVSEFDDVESTIFDRRELSRQGSSSRNKLTTSANSGKSDVSIKNWAGLAHDYVTSNAESMTEFADAPVNTKDSKRLKTRKIRNASKPNRVKARNARTRELKLRPSSKSVAKKTDNLSSLRAQLIRRSSISSGNSDAASKQQKEIVRRKRRPVKQVSFDNSNIENATKLTTSDSAFFGSRTESRGEEQSSPKPPESEHSDRATSRCSAVETERDSTISTRPVSTAQSARSSLSISQHSRQTSLVERVTAVNHPPVIHGKKTQLPAMRHRRRGKLADSVLICFAKYACSSSRGLYRRL